MSKRGEATRQLILEKSFDLFARKGYRSVTMKDICEETGLSRGGLYGHFDSTEQIFMEVMEQMPKRKQAELREKMEQGDSAVKILDEMLAEFLSNVAREKRFFSLAVCDFFTDPDHCRDGNLIEKNFSQVRRSWTDLIRYGQKRGEFRQVDPEGVYTLIACCDMGFRMLSQYTSLNLEEAGRAARTFRSLLIR